VLAVASISRIPVGNVSERSMIRLGLAASLEVAVTAGIDVHAEIRQVIQERPWRPVNTAGQERPPERSIQACGADDVDQWRPS
jgi:hypothetical protein